MELSKRIQAFLDLKNCIQNYLEEENSENNHFNYLDEKIKWAEIKNPWFTNEFILKSLIGIEQIIPNDLENIINENYEFNRIDKNVGVISAGNIPLAGFHDFMCVILSGNNYFGKLSHKDDVLLPALSYILCDLHPELNGKISFEEGMLKNMDAYITSGSNNSSRYFDSYFGKYPNIIRKNRNGVVILNGAEDESQLDSLMDDVFSYFGKGCRSVSKILVPHDYNFEKLHASLQKKSHFLSHVKYYNNYIYQKTILALAQRQFMDLESALLVEQKELITPVGTLAYELYSDNDELSEILERDKSQIQCIVGQGHLEFGKAQSPQFLDFADDIDTLKFLGNL
jgi:hypothetical protein